MFVITKSSDMCVCVCVIDMYVPHVYFENL